MRLLSIVGLFFMCLIGTEFALAHSNSETTKTICETSQFDSNADAEQNLDSEIFGDSSCSCAFRSTRCSISCTASEGKATCGVAYPNRCDCFCSKNG